MNKALNHTKTLYIDLILDGSKYANYEGVEKFIRVFEWAIQGSISDTDFSELYKMWNKKTDDERSTSILREEEFRQILLSRSMDLDLMLGILINEHNRNFQQKGCKLQWLQCVEHLFFILDAFGNSFITMDEVQFFIIALLGERAINVDPEQILSRTNDFMVEVGHYDGVITLRRLKEFFFQNDLDIQAIQDSVQFLEAHLIQWQRFPFFSPEAIESGCIPRIWQQAIIDVQKENLSNIYDSLDQYLLQESYTTRFKFIRSIFENEGVLKIFENYVIRYPLRNEDEVKQEYLIYIKKVMTRYRHIINNIILNISNRTSMEIVREKEQINSKKSVPESQTLMNLQQYEKEQKFQKNKERIRSSKNNLISYSQRQRKNQFEKNLFTEPIKFKQIESQPPTKMEEFINESNRTPSTLSDNTYEYQSEIRNKITKSQVDHETFARSSNNIRTPTHVSVMPSTGSNNSASISPGTINMPSSLIKSDDEAYQFIDPVLVNRMVRNAEWIDVRPDKPYSLFAFQYLNPFKRKKNVTMDNVQELQIELEYKKQEISKLKQQQWSIQQHSTQPQVQYNTALHDHKQAILLTESPTQLQTETPQISRGATTMTGQTMFINVDQEYEDQISHKELIEDKKTLADEVEPDISYHDQKSSTISDIFSPTDEITPTSLKQVLRKIRERNSQQKDHLNKILFEGNQSGHTVSPYNAFSSTNTTSGKPICITLDEKSSTYDDSRLSKVIKDSFIDDDQLIKTIQSMKLSEVPHRKERDEEYQINLTNKSREAKVPRLASTFPSNQVFSVRDVRKANNKMIHNPFLNEGRIEEEIRKSERNFGKKIKEREKGWKL